MQMIGILLKGIFCIELGIYLEFYIHIHNILIWLFWENHMLFIKSWRIELFGNTREHCKSQFIFLLTLWAFKRFISPFV
jgi:hypothetical protein